MLIDTRMHLYGQKYTLPCPSIAHFIVRRLLVVLYCSVSVRHYNCLFCHAEPQLVGQSRQQTLRRTPPALWTTGKLMWESSITSPTVHSEGKFKMHNITLHSAATWVIITMS